MAGPRVARYIAIMTDKTFPASPRESQDDAPKETKALSPAARRALAEAEARRVAAATEAPRPVEHQGPKGPEPTRYGDWERKGIASDF